jgi:hypothetical protein
MNKNKDAHKSIKVGGDAQTIDIWAGVPVAYKIEAEQPGLHKILFKYNTKGKLLVYGSLKEEFPDNHS